MQPKFTLTSPISLTLIRPGDAAEALELLSAYLQAAPSDADGFAVRAQALGKLVGRCSARCCLTRVRPTVH